MNKNKEICAAFYEFRGKLNCNQYCLTTITMQNVIEVLLL